MVELKPFSQLEIDTTIKVFPLSFVVSRLFSYLCRQKPKTIYEYGKVFIQTRRGEISYI